MKVWKFLYFCILPSKRQGHTDTNPIPYPHTLSHTHILIMQEKDKLSGNYAVGVDVGGSHVCSVVVDVQSGELLSEPFTTEVDHTCSAEEIFSAWTLNLRRTISSSPVPVRQVGMAFPGPFDYAAGISHMEHKFPGIIGLNVGEILSARLLDFKGLCFKYVNDAGAFALGESLYGAAAGIGRVLVLTLGTGLGSGFVADRKIITEGDEVPKGGEVWDIPYGDGIADEKFSTRWIVGRYGQLSGIKVKGAKDVALRVGSDPEARQVFNEFGEGLADFTAPILRKFRCSDILLGGNISRSLDLFLPAMTHRYAREGMDVKVKASILLDKAAMMGAASLFGE